MLIFRPHAVLSSQLNLDSYYLDELQELQQRYTDILILDACKEHNYTKRCDINTHEMYVYPEVLKQATFCLIFRGERIGQYSLLEAMAANCIPVVVIDGLVMPFSNIIDWKRAAIFIMEDYLSTLMEVLGSISQNRIKEMQKQIKFLYEKYFTGIKSVLETTLDIIQDRVYPHWGRTYDDWNLSPDEVILNLKFW